MARLRQHQELDLDALRREDTRAVIRLSDEFHSLAAELAGYTALARSMPELTVLTCLMIFLYDAPHRPAAAAAGGPGSGLLLARQRPPHHEEEPAR